MKPAPSQFSFGAFEFDPSQRELSRAGERVSLPSTLNKLLFLLVSRRGQLVTREEIADALWADQGTVDVENGINGAVRRLRSQLSVGTAKGEASDLYVETVVGTGYRFAVPVFEMVAASMVPAAVERIPEVSVHEDNPVPGVPKVDAATAHRRRGFALGQAATGVAALAVVVIAGLGYAGLTRYRGSAGRTSMTLSVLSVDWMPVTYKEVEDGLTAQALSASGEYVAVSDRSGITVQRLHEQNARRLDAPDGLQVDDLSWFPDDRRLLVSGVQPGGGKTGGLAEAWIVSLGNESPRLLLEDAAMATVSPDGRRVAYARAGRSEIWVADADGQGTRRLVSGKTGETLNCLLWSPGSDRLVVDRGIEGREATDVEKGAVDQLQHQNEWTYESYDATNGRLLGRQADVHFDAGLLLADGRFVYPVTAAGEELRLREVMTDLRTGAIVPGHGSLTPAGFGIGAVSLRDLTASGAGGDFTALLERPSSDVYVGELRYRSSDGIPEMANAHRLTDHTGTTYPTAWSPDGEEMIFDEGDAGRWVIARQRLNGGKMEVVADTGGRAVQGQFTVDGKWVLFLHYGGKPSRVQSIDRVPATGGRSEPIYESGEIQDFHCSRSSIGSCVVREAAGKKELVFYALTAEGGRGKEVARTPWMPNVLGDWSLSPDGKTVAVANHDAHHPGFALLGLGETPAGRTSTSIMLNGFGTVLCPTWAVDGKGFFVETNSASGYDLVYVDLQGHGSVLMKSPDPIWAVQSRDGKRLSYPGHTPLNRNVWSGKIL